MAEKHIVTVEADTREAEENLDKVADGLKDVKKEADKAGDEVKKIGDSAKKAKDGTSKLSKGFKSVGTAIKGMGIGLVLAAFAALAKLASENQFVMDKLSTAGTALQLAFNDLVKFVKEDVLVYFERLKTFFSNFTFEDFKKALKENIMERIQSVIDMFGYLAEAVKKVFEGDFSGAMDAAKNAGKEFVDTMTGVDGTVDKVSQTVSNAVTAVSEYGSKTWEAAEATTALAKAAEVAAAQQELLLKQYENENEILRQQRDNIFATNEERQAASKALGENLEKQAKLMLEQAALVQANADAQYALNATDENYIAVLEAKRNTLDVEATIQGFRSEQLAQQNALIQEQIDKEKEAEETKAENAEKEKKRLEDEKKAREEKLKADEDEALKRREYDRMVMDSKIELVNQISALADQETAIGKALIVFQQAMLIQKEIMNIKETASEAKKALQKAILNGAVAQTDVATGFGATMALGFPAAIPFLVAYAASAVGIISSVIAAINGVKGVAGSQGGGSGGGGSISAPTASAPNFNIVQSSPQNNQSTNLVTPQEPMKAYVVSTEISTQQELDRKTEGEATISG